GVVRRPDAESDRGHPPDVRGVVLPVPRGAGVPDLRAAPGPGGSEGRAGAPRAGAGRVVWRGGAYRPRRPAADRRPERAEFPAVAPRADDRQPVKRAGSGPETLRLGREPRRVAGLHRRRAGPGVLAIQYQGLLTPDGPRLPALHPPPLRRHPRRG